MCASDIPLAGAGSGRSTIPRKSATRASSARGTPMKKSAPRGPAISRRTIVPSERPLVRRTTSPTRNPKVLTWYPCAVPGSHHGAWAASAAHMASQSKTASSGSGSRTAGRPA